MIKCECYKKMMCEECFDNPNNFYNLPKDKQKQLCSWIEVNLNKRIKCINKSLSSYGLKAKFENSTNAFYINNGQFKGAMHILNFKHTQGLNWNFNISKKQL